MRSVQKEPAAVRGTGETRGSGSGIFLCGAHLSVQRNMKYAGREAEGFRLREGRRKMFQNCVFDLYGTLVDIRTDEENPEIWKRLALFLAYYGAGYQAEELKKSFERQVRKRMNPLNAAVGEKTFRSAAQGAEGYPEMKIEEVFLELYRKKGAEAGMELAVHTGQFFRSLSTKRLRLYDGVPELLRELGKAGKKLFLLSNAQRIFTAYELRALGISDCLSLIHI